MRWQTQLLESARSHLRSWPWSLMVIGSLALALGASTATFSVVRNVLLEPLPYVEPDRLVTLWFSIPARGLDRVGNSAGTFLLLEQETPALDAIAIAEPWEAALAGADVPSVVPLARVTAGVFAVLGSRPALGRVLQASDSLPGAERVVVISDALWREQFAADPAVIGKRIELDGEIHTVVAVLPHGPGFPKPNTRAWTPLIYDAAQPDLSSFTLDTYGRLSSSSGLADAQAQIERGTFLLADRYPEVFQREVIESGLVKAQVTPLQQELVGDTGGIIWLVYGAALLILCLACTNSANLFLARRERMAHVEAIHAAFGATARLLLRRVLMDVLLLTSAAAIAGVAFAAAAVGWLRRSLAAVLPRAESLDMDAAVLGFSMLIAVTVALFLAWIAIRAARRREIASALRLSARGHTAAVGAVSLRRALLVVQVALATVLLTGTALTGRAFLTLRNTDPGFTHLEAQALRFSFPQLRYRDRDDIARFARSTLERLRARTDVATAAFVSNLPLRDGRARYTFEFEDRPTPVGEPPQSLRTQWISDQYFDALGLRMIDGRAIDAGDLDRRSAVAVVSNALAQRLWPAESALGKRLQFSSTRGGGEGPFHTVVGVVSDIRDRSLEEPWAEMVYLPITGPLETAEIITRRMSLLVLGRDGTTVPWDAITESLRSFDPRMAVADVGSLAQAVSVASAPTRVAFFALTTAAAVALLIACAGVFGLASYLVAQRGPEIAVRLAVGAGPRTVRNSVLMEQLKPVALGLVLGVAGMTVARVLAGKVVFALPPLDALSVITVCAALALASAVACYLPARRASLTDPAWNLKQT